MHVPFPAEAVLAAAPPRLVVDDGRESSALSSRDPDGPVTRALHAVPTSPAARHGTPSSR